MDESKKFILKYPFIAKYVLSCIAATVAETVTYPLDITKTRLQTRGELGSKYVQRPGMFKTIFEIIKQEGMLKLWDGLPPAVYRHLVYTGCRMGIYEYLRENILKKDAKGNFPVWKAAAGGVTAGALGQFFSSPTDLVKVLLQTEGRRRLEGHPPRVHGTLHALKVVLAEGGVLGLWRGCVPNVQRAALVNMGDLATYDTAKRTLMNYLGMKDNYILHACSSGMSGLVAASLGTPADFVKTRMMNQPIVNGKGTLYKSSIDCAIKTVRTDGFWVLYRGFVPIWARMAPWSLTFWVSFEEIRRITGTPSF